MEIFIPAIVLLTALTVHASYIETTLTPKNISKDEDLLSITCTFTRWSRSVKITSLSIHHTKDVTYSAANIGDTSPNIIAAINKDYMKITDVHFIPGSELSGDILIDEAFLKLAINKTFTCEDGGVYICKGYYNDSSSARTNNTIEDSKVLTFEAQPETPLMKIEPRLQESQQVYAVGTEVTITCSGNVGKPAKVFRWEVYSEASKTWEAYVQDSTADSRVLPECTSYGEGRIRQTMADTEPHHFRCLVGEGNHTTSAATVVNAATRIKATIFPTNMTENTNWELLEDENTTIQLECQLQNHNKQVPLSYIKVFLTSQKGRTTTDLSELEEATVSTDLNPESGQPYLRANISTDGSCRYGGTYSCVVGYQDDSGMVTLQDSAIVTANPRGKGFRLRLSPFSSGGYAPGTQVTITCSKVTVEQDSKISWEQYDPESGKWVDYVGSRGPLRSKYVSECEVYNENSITFTTPDTGSHNFRCYENAVSVNGVQAITSLFPSTISILDIHDLKDFTIQCSYSEGQDDLVSTRSLYIMYGGIDEEVLMLAAVYSGYDATIRYPPLIGQADAQGFINRAYASKSYLSLKIRMKNWNHRGSYTCLGRYKIGNDYFITEDTKAAVYTSKASKITHTRDPAPPETGKYPEGTTITLKCRAYIGSTPLQWSWEKQDTFSEQWSPYVKDMVQGPAQLVSNAGYESWTTLKFTVPDHDQHNFRCFIGNDILHSRAIAVNGPLAHLVTQVSPYKIILWKTEEAVINCTFSDVPVDADFANVALYREVPSDSSTANYAKIAEITPGKQPVLFLTRRVKDIDVFGKIATKETYLGVRIRSIWSCEDAARYSCRSQYRDATGDHNLTDMVTIVGESKPKSLRISYVKKDKYAIGSIVSLKCHGGVGKPIHEIRWFVYDEKLKNWIPYSENVGPSLTKKSSSCENEGERSLQFKVPSENKHILRCAAGDVTSENVVIQGSREGTTPPSTKDGGNNSSPPVMSPQQGIIFAVCLCRFFLAYLTNC